MGIEYLYNMSILLKNKFLFILKFYLIWAREIDNKASRALAFHMVNQFNSWHQQDNLCPDRVIPKTRCVCT